MNRVMTPAAELVWIELNTRWPVSAALIATSAESKIADFADHDHVRIAAQDVSQHRVEAHLVGRVDFDLRDADDIELDRVFDRDEPARDDSPADAAAPRRAWSTCRCRSGRRAGSCPAFGRVRGERSHRQLATCRAG